MSRLGDLLHLERTRRGLSAKAVAKKGGVSEKYLLEVEAGTRIIQDDQARRILKVMGSEPTIEAQFTLEDIASTVDLQSAVQMPQKAPEEKTSHHLSSKEAPTEGQSIWIDALSAVLKRVPVIDAASREVGSRLLPVSDGKIEGAPKDKVFYFQAPDDEMKGFRIQKGDWVLTLPSGTPQEDTVMLLQFQEGRALRHVKLLPRYQVMLQSYGDRARSEIVNLQDLNIIGRCIRVEFDL